jgi:hypothetical protein
MPAATDWDGTFLPSALAHFNGGEMNINNPPYVLFPLIPFALLPVDAGRVLVLLVALAALALVAFRIGAQPPVVAPILARIELPVLEPLAQWRLAHRVKPMQDRIIAFSIAVSGRSCAQASD